MPNKNKKNRPWMDFQEAKMMNELRDRFIPARQDIELEDLMKPQQIINELVQQQMDKIAQLPEVKAKEVEKRQAIANQLNLENQPHVKPAIKRGAGVWEQLQKGRDNRADFKVPKGEELKEKLGILFHGDEEEKKQRAIDDMWRHVAMKGQILPMRGERVFMPDNKVYIWDDKWVEMVAVEENPRDAKIRIQNDWMAEEWANKVMANQGQVQLGGNVQIVNNPNWGHIAGNHAMAGNQNVVIGQIPLQGHVFDGNVANQWPNNVGGGWDNPMAGNYNPYKQAIKEPVNEDELKISIDKTCNLLATKEINLKYGKEVVEYKGRETKMADDLQDEFLEIFDRYYDIMTDEIVKA